MVFVWVMLHRSCTLFHIQCICIHTYYTSYYTYVSFQFKYELALCCVMQMVACWKRCCWKSPSCAGSQPQCVHKYFIHPYIHTYMHTRTVEARVLFQCPPIKRNIFLFAFSRANTLTDLHSFNYTYMYSMPHSYIKYIQTYVHTVYRFYYRFSHVWYNRYQQYIHTH